MTTRTRSTLPTSLLLAVPVLVYVLGQDVHQATIASLLVVTVGAVVGGLGHAREGRVCWRHAIAFTAAAVPGVIGGAALGQAVSGKALIAAFAVIMLAAAGATWRKAHQDVDSPPADRSQPTCPPLQLASVVMAGLVIGAMTGFFGVGGGFLIVPTLAIGLAFSMRLAVGASLAIITVTSLMALVAHLATGRTIDVGMTFTMKSACVAGALIGVGLAERAPQRQLADAFASLVVVVAAYLIVSIAVLGGPPGTA